jgi:hypothetical protein
MTAADRPRLDRAVLLARAALPILAVLSFALGVTGVIAAAGETLGYDYQAYAAAAQRLLDGQPLYDPNVDVAGPFAIYLYPPPFAVAFIPFALAPAPLGLWAWIAASIAMTAVAIWLMPVGTTVRWAVFLLAGLDWPVLFAIKLGQVGPLLLLLFVIGWRLLRSQIAVGLVGAAGTLIKMQPALVLGWALLTRRWTTLLSGAAIVLIAVVLTLPFVGGSAWSDYARLLGRVNEPVTTPHNMTPGAAAFLAGLDVSTANLVQLGALVAAITLWIVAVRRRSPEAGFLATAVTSQLVSPLLWDHYAMLLLLPVAWLLQRRQWWAVLVPIATSLPLVAVTPIAAYPVAFFVCLLALILVRDPVPQPAR